MQKITGGQIKLRNFPFKELMKKAGYGKLPNGSYVKYFRNSEREKYRYHIYFLEEEIVDIHTDKLKKRNGKSFHIASRYLVKEEKRRLKTFLPSVEKPLKTKPQRLTIKELKDIYKNLTPNTKS